MKITNFNTTDNQEHTPSPNINLIIGANNAGKTTFIKELHGSMMKGFLDKNNAPKWLSGVKLSINNSKQAFSDMFESIENGSMDISNLSDLDARNFQEIAGFRPHRANFARTAGNIHFSALVSAITDGDLIVDIPLASFNSTQRGGSYYLRSFLSEVSVLGEFCDSRLQESFTDTVNDVLDTNDSGSTVRRLLGDAKLFKSIQQNVLENFGIKIGFDDLAQGNRPLRIIPKHLPSKKLSPRDRALKWKQSSALISEQGDGIKAYIKLVLGILENYYDIIFIDEPEAFLHPPQRRSLGQLMAKIAIDYNKQLFISTHDSEFLRGMLGSSDESGVMVYRITDTPEGKQINDIALSTISNMIKTTQKKMPNTKVRLYNEAVLNSLFYKKTLLLESEYDRMFYEYYSELRLHEYITNVNFIGFNGMPDIKIVFDEMHNLGINVACIVDIDFLLSNKQVPDCIRTSDQALYQKHVKIAQMYSSRGDNEKTEFKTSLKRDGLKYLEAADQTLFSEYESVIADYSARGVFIVKVGELERWTKSSKDNMSEMLGKIEKTDFRDIKLFMKSALKVRS